MDTLYSAQSNPTSHINAISNQDLLQFTKESEVINYVENQIDRIFSEEQEKALELSKKLNQFCLNLKKSHPALIEKLNEQLFEIGLELFCENKNEVAQEILMHTYIRGHKESEFCWQLHKHHAGNGAWVESMSIPLLESAAEDKTRGLKATPYFLGCLYQQGIYGITIDALKAEKYLTLAKEQGYKTRAEKKTCQEFILMLEGSQSPGSVLHDFPLDITRKITLDRIEYEFQQRNKE